MTDCRNGLAGKGTSDYLLTMRFHKQGFTLVELLIVIAIVAILGSLAAPSFNTFLLKRSVQSASDTLVNDIRYARSEALRRSTRVSICSLAANTTGTCSAAGSASWANGWIVFVDTTNLGTVDAGEEIVRVQQAPQSIASIQSTNTASDRSRITFEANGFAKSADQTFIVTPTGSVPANSTRLVCISIMGRPSLRVQGTTACVD